MPGPGIYVVAVVVGVAAGLAFKEFVYDPHLAPKIEQWADAYTAYRVERRRRRAPPLSLHVHSDDEGESQSSPAKDELELERLVEREMQTLGREATLRQRNFSSQESNSLEMLERPNPFVPFAPLTPSSPSLQSSTTFLSPENVTMPISRLPTLQSEQRPSPRVSGSVARSTADVQPQTHPPIPSYSVTISLTGHSQPASRINSSMSERSVPATASRVSSPFTSASISRAGTPWSDVQSASSADVLSEASFSDNLSEASSVSEMEHPYLSLDLSLIHATSSQISLSNQSDISLGHSEASFDTSSSSSVKTRSDVSADFLEPDGEQPADLVDSMLAPGSTPGMLSDEEWERISDAGRSAHPQ